LFQNTNGIKNTVADAFGEMQTLLGLRGQGNFALAVA